MDPVTLVSVKEYLHTSFPDGDREYLDGEIVERNMGELDHSDAQSTILVYFRTRYKGRFWAGVELRVQVAPTRFRVPDVCVVPGPKPRTQILTSPPVLVVEVLSPDDRAGYIEEKIQDYLAFGVPCVWIVNPRTRRGFIHTPEGSREAKDGVLRVPDGSMEMPLAGVFE